MNVVVNDQTRTCKVMLVLNEEEEDNKDQSLDIPPMIPEEILPQILCFCSFDTLLITRIANKTFRDILVPKEFMYRFGTDTGAQENDEEDTTVSGWKFSRSDYWGWGLCFKDTVKEALRLAKNEFNSSREDGQDGIWNVEGYDEVDVRSVLSEKKQLAVVHDKNEAGLGYWRVEASHKLISLVDAIKELKISFETAGKDDSVLYLLMSATSKTIIHRAEIEVHGRGRQDNPRRYFSARQVITLQADGRPLQAFAVVAVGT